jgi:hypothetical protein
MVKEYTVWDLFLANELATSHHAQINSKPIELPVEWVKKLEIHQRSLSCFLPFSKTAPLVSWSEFLATYPVAPGSIPDATQIF